MLTQSDSAVADRLAAAWRHTPRVPLILIVLASLAIALGVTAGGMQLGGRHPHRVTYTVTGSGPANVSYAVPLDDGKIRRVVRHVSLPWTRTVLMSGAVTDYEMLAKSNSPRQRATIRCTLAVDGQPAWQSQQTAPLARVVCYGTPYDGR